MLHVSKDCNKATICGIIRNDKGKIDIAFTRPIGDVPIRVAECMTISMGVRLARTRKIRSIKVESDSTEVIKAINGEIYCPWKILTLVQEILDEKKKFDRMSLDIVTGKTTK